MPFGEVVRDVSAMTVFTTHTPVAAGHDRFPAPLVEEHLGKIREALHLSYEDFMGLGRVYPGDPNEPFCMTVLALKLSRYANGVSALHGTVSRRMWQPLFVNTAEENVPIGHITNGVHVQSWVAPQMHLLFDRHLGTDWPKHQRLPETWEGDQPVEDAELWETQQVLKARMINFVRNRLVSQARRRDEPDAAIERAMEALDLNALTIGFARRFATYKRSGLVLQDVERLDRDGQLGRPADPVHLRRQGPPRGPDGQGADPEHRPADAAGRVRHADRVRRGLRHERRPAARAGGGRLAEQSAAAAGGQRHLRPEGRSQRRAEFLDPRRMVGRGV